MRSSSNPWTERFLALLDRDEIARRAAVQPEPLGDLSAVPLSQAKKLIRDQLERVFYPTAQCVDILQGWISLSYRHCLDYYLDATCFLEQLNDDASRFPASVPLICLTGLAGAGKTELVKALRRILPPDSQLTVSPDYPAIPLRTLWTATVNAGANVVGLLSQFTQCPGTVKELIGTCRHLAYRDGVAMAVADELQFASGSSKANTLVTQILLALTYLGLPAAFVANYSLVHRLLRRPHEDRHRLLSRPVVLLPEAADSSDWTGVLQAQVQALPRTLAFDPIADAAAVHRYCAADLRAEVALLVSAFELSTRAGRQVGLREIEAAYRSTGYSVYRDDVEALMLLSLADNRARRKRPDLVCPFDLPPTATARFVQQSQRSRQNRADEQALRSALTADERTALASLEKSRRRAGHLPPEAVVTPSKKSVAPTAQELAGRLRRFSDRLT